MHWRLLLEAPVYFGEGFETITSCCGLLGHTGLSRPLYLLEWDGERENFGLEGYFGLGGL